MVSRSSSVDVISQCVSRIMGVQSDVSQIVSEYNAEIQPILDSLPQGRADTRWTLTDDVYPKKNGLDATQIFVDNDATSKTSGGRYWRLDSSRPKTIEEVLNTFYSDLLSQADQLRTEVSSLSSTGIPSRAVGLIGNNIFDASQASGSTSIDSRLSNSELHIFQLARDLYDDTYDSWTAAGVGLLTNRSLRDMVDDLLSLHNSSWDTTTSASHSGVSGLTILTSDQVQLTNWDGTGRSTQTGTLDMSSIASSIFPSTAPSAWLLRIKANDSGSAGGTAGIKLKKSLAASDDTAAELEISGVTDSIDRCQDFIVRCDSSGDIYYSITATGVSTFGVRISCLGYII